MQSESLRPSLEAASRDAEIGYCATLKQAGFGRLALILSGSYDRKAEVPTCRSAVVRCDGRFQAGQQQRCYWSDFGHEVIKEWDCRRVPSFMTVSMESGGRNRARDSIRDSEAGRGDKASKGTEALKDATG